MKKTIETNYSHESDRTFIMEVEWYDEYQVKSIECIGWYYGEPNDESTKKYSNRDLKVEYKYIENFPDVAKEVR